MRERTEEAALAGMLVPVEAMTCPKNVVIKLHHGQHGGMKEVDVFLHGWRCQLEDSAREKDRVY